MRQYRDIGQLLGTHLISKNLSICPVCFDGLVPAGEAIDELLCLIYRTRADSNHFVNNVVYVSTTWASIGCFRALVAKSYVLGSIRISCGMGVSKG